MREPEFPDGARAGENLTVLFVSNFEGTFAGSDRSLVGLLNALPETLGRVVVSPGDPAKLARYVAHSDRVRFLQAPFHSYPYTMRDLQERAPWGTHRTLTLAYLLANNLAIVERLSGDIEDARPDIVHSNTSTVVLGALIAACWNLPHVWHVRETIATRGRAMRSWIAMIRAFADLVVAPSHAAAAPLGRGVEIVPDVFEPRMISLLAQQGRDRLARRLPVHPGDVLIVAAGVSTPVKGHHVLVRALRRILDADEREGRARRLRLVLAGALPDEAYRRQLEETADDLGVTDRLEILGHLPYEEMLSLLAAADVVVHPAALEDALPAVPREAMVLGTPVVASDTGGLRELVAHEINGLLCRPNDAEDLAAGVRRLLNDPALATALAERAAVSVRSEQRVQAEVAAYHDIYARLVSRPRGDAAVRWHRSLLRRLSVAVRALAETTRMKIFLEETVAARDEELGSVKYVLAARDREVAALRAALAERDEEVAALRRAVDGGPRSERETDVDPGRDRG